MNKYDDTDYLIEREESIEYEEKAKRQTENTINYYKNIEKIEEVPIDILRAMYKDVIAELKQDKKRIEELEAKLEFKSWGDLDNIQFEEYMNQFIQKVKDKIEELKKEYEIALEENSTKAFVLKCQINALEELLEDK